MTGGPLYPGGDQDVGFYNVNPFRGGEQGHGFYNVIHPLHGGEQGGGFYNVNPIPGVEQGCVVYNVNSLGANFGQGISLLSGNFLPGDQRQPYGGLSFYSMAPGSQLHAVGGKNHGLHNVNQPPSCTPGGQTQESCQVSIFISVEDQAETQPSQSKVKADIVF